MISDTSGALVVKPADFARWRRELHFTLFGGAMLMVKLEPFADLADLDVQTMLAAIPKGVRGRVELIYNRSKSYYDEGLLPARARQKPALYRRLYVKRDAYIAFCRSQAFDVPKELDADIPNSGWFRSDRTPIAEPDVARRATLVDEIAPKIKNGKAEMKRFFDGSHGKGEATPAHRFRVLDAAGQPKKGLYDRAGVLKHFEAKLAEAKNTPRIRGVRF